MTDKNTATATQSFYIFTATDSPTVPVVMRHEFALTGHEAASLCLSRHPGEELIYPVSLKHWNKHCRQTFGNIGAAYEGSITCKTCEDKRCLRATEPGVKPCRFAEAKKVREK
jgi:hypothetical protein